MQSDEIRSRLTPIFRDIFRDSSLLVSDQMTAQDVPGWDSLSHINMIMAVEKAFKVKFSIKDVRSMKDVGGMVELIKKKSGVA
jgi:acyl carrier protein